jgi:arylsulfatase A-like enzyme
MKSMIKRIRLAAIAFFVLSLLTIQINRHVTAQTQQPSLQSKPNVVFIVLDDAGFADLGCYGSEINTPNIDRLAAGGLRYNNFHTTALCSPTRAALLTGRNHHTVGMRAISNIISAEENTRGKVTKKAAMLPEILRDEGYNTFALGKWHLAPMHETTPAGPLRRLAPRTRLRSLLRLSGRRDRSMGARHHLRQPSYRTAQKARLSPDRRSGGPLHRIHRQPADGAARQAFLSLSGFRRRPRAASRAARIH